jgi:hypothetical protein
MSTHPDGGQFESTASALITAPDALPCEIDQTKLDPISRLACSTNLSKILKEYPPKRALLDRRPRLESRGVLELDALAVLPALQRLTAFLREPFKIIKTAVAGQG